MKEIYSLISEYKEGDYSKVIDVIVRFDPLLDKFQRNTNCEDMKRVLILFLIDLLKKISANLDKFENNKFVVSYIQKSLRNKYIIINKRIVEKYNTENVLLDHIASNKYEEQFSNIIFNDIIKNLIPKERYVLCKIYIQDLKVSEIARELGVSRQAIYKVHIRALKKLKRSFVL